MKTLTISMVSTLALMVGCAQNGGDLVIGDGHFALNEVENVTDFSGNTHGTAKFDRDDNLEFKIKTTTGLTPGDVVTVWMCGFNNPDGCLGGAEACGACEDYDDTSAVCNGVDRSNDPTFQYKAADAQTFCKWGAGSVVKSNGKYKGSGDDDADAEHIMGPDPDHDNAVVQFFLRTHGPASDDEATLEAQLNTYDGGCSTNECSDLMVVTFTP